MGMKTSKVSAGIMIVGLVATASWGQTAGQGVPGAVLTATPAATASPRPKEDSSAPPTAPSATPQVEKPITLSDRVGVGYDYIRIDEVQYPNFFTGNISVLALDATYWLSEKSALDLLVTGNFSSNPGTDFNGNSVNYPDNIWGLGLQWRYNIASPARNLLIQGLLRGTYCQYNFEQIWNSNNNIALQLFQGYSESYCLSVGAGFEYFLPFFDSISLQGNILFTASYNDGWLTSLYNPNQNTPNYTLNYSYYRTLFSNTGLNLTTLTIHFYP